VNLHALVRKRGPLDATHVAHYIAQAAEGLQHIHEAGLIHRDIKPGNLLVDTTGTVKILDLGLARFLHDAGDAITKKFDGRAILGTADFMSPEQALKSHNADIRSDIYGLGATAYFLLTGRAPFEDEQNIAKKLLAHQMRAPEPIAALRGDVPAGLIAAVDRMMAKPREDRFQEPFEVADALAEWTQTPIPPPAADDIPRRAGSSSQASTAPGGRTSRNSSSFSRSMARRSARNDTPIPSALPPAPPQGTSKSIPRIAKSVKLVLGKLTTDRRRRTLIAAAVTLLLTGAGGLLVWRPWAAGSSVPPPAQSAPNNGGAAAK
jgi:serine/threonine protein kinase